MYALLCDIFAKDCNIFLKPHPGDISDYSVTFKDEIIMDREMPSELTRFIIDKNFDIGICTYSTSIDSLKPYIDSIYNVDDTIVDYKDNIFKLYFLFELAEKLNYGVKSKKNSLIQCFNKFYNLKDDINIVYNDFTKNITDIIVKNEYFSKANIIIEINKNIENSVITQDVEKLYMQVIDSQVLKEIINFNFNNFLSISKVKISTNIGRINV